MQAEQIKRFTDWNLERKREKKKKQPPGQQHFNMTDFN